jgi:glycogen debranching enzyme
MLTISSQCPTQAWSAGCIIDLYDDASKYSLETL